LRTPEPSGESEVGSGRRSALVFQKNAPVVIAESVSIAAINFRRLMDIRFMLVWMIELIEFIKLIVLIRLIESTVSVNQPVNSINLINL
jgi:hypothetical protein